MMPTTLAARKGSFENDKMPVIANARRRLKLYLVVPADRGLATNEMVAVRVGFRTATISFVANPRSAGTTKYNLRRLLAFAITGILSFSKLPLRAASVVGIIISTVSLAYAIALI